MSARPELPAARDWKPRHRGLIYCSPACGGNCTRAAYHAAKNNAALLAKRLGPGWKPRVWENLGWHYSAVKGKAEVDVQRLTTGARARTRTYYTMTWDVKPHIVVQATSVRKLLKGARGLVKKLSDDMNNLVGPP